MMFLLVCGRVFLILLILIQRGRGGGLAGAFGGMGGQSAFGTKAGDVFTRITIVTAAIWISLCAASVKVFGSGKSLSTATMGTARPAASASAPAAPPARAACRSKPAAAVNRPTKAPAPERRQPSDRYPAATTPAANGASRRVHRRAAPALVTAAPAAGGANRRAAPAVARPRRQDASAAPASRPAGSK